MIRIVTVAALAAALAAPAAAETIRIPTAGKTTAQINAEIVAAAREICLPAMNATLPLVGYSACRKKTIADAKAQLGAPAYAAAARSVADR